MNKMHLLANVCALALAGLCTAPGALAQHHPDTRASIEAQRTAMQPFAEMAGIWRGSAKMQTRNGTHTIVQTERVGPFLGGQVMMIEGRGYEMNGQLSFNALGVISYNPASKAYTMRAHAMGHVGNFPLTPTADGFTWDVKAGPTTMHYVAVIKNGSWHEVGERILPDGHRVRFIEINLKRVADTDWPAAGAVPFRKP